MQPSITLRHQDRFPFLALGGVNGREHQIILVEQRRPGLVAGGIGRIERELGQEALARSYRWMRSGQAAQGRPGADGVVMDAFQMRRRTSDETRSSSAGQPVVSPCTSRRPRPANVGQSRDGGGAGQEGGDGLQRLGAPGMIRSRRRPAVAGPDCRAGVEATRKPDAPVARVLRPAQKRQHVLDMRALSRNLRPPNLTNGILRRVSSTSSGPLWCEARKSTAWALSATPASRCSRTLARRHNGLDRLRRARSTNRGRSADARSDHRFLVKRSGACSITAFAAARIGCGRAVVAVERDDCGARA